MKQKLFLLLLLAVHLAGVSMAQNAYNRVIDVQHYTFTLELNDINDEIKATAAIKLVFRQNANAISLDLVGKNGRGKGMLVTAVAEDGLTLAHQQAGDKLIIQLRESARAGDTATYLVSYTGAPGNGLVFSKNKFKQRTIFADNWPNRARYWLPCVDHLSDKAGVDFIVTAPSHYKVISNGELIEESSTGAGLKLTHWRENIPLPTKVMVIGLADFAVNIAGNIDCIPVSSWVFPADKEKGFYDYAQALEILPFFIKTIGAYPYKKLANVEAITIFGGMENAAAIFYSERSITGKRGYSEELIAHEIAHQWFGNAATESGWPHVWLSEGFATAMTNYYLENKYGVDTLKARLTADRKTIFDFEKERFTPVVDSSEKLNYMALLNRNSYEKGGWVLHMLRRKLGDDLFWKGIRRYYELYSGKNASTDDFKKVMEAVSSISLTEFFQQWLYSPGHPSLDINWKYDEAKKSIQLKVTQLQTTLFSFQLEMVFKQGNTAADQQTIISIKDRTTQITLKMATKPTRVITDPSVHLLFQSLIREQ